jgi:asparagine N-glycosylation enzyme membrane subunit Stt3
MRIELMQQQGLFEPDGFTYYAAIKQAIAQGFFLYNNTVNLSGYPWHYKFGEAPGLLYATLIPYAILQFFGVSALAVMRSVAIFFGIMTAVLCYFVVRYLAKSRMLGLLAMLMISVSGGNIIRTGGTVYRGDSFIGVFTLLALLFMLMALYEEKPSRRYMFAFGSALLIGINILVWNGGAVTLSVYIASVMLIFIYGFVSGNESILRKNGLLLLALLVGYLLESLFVSFFHLMDATTVGAIEFVVLFVPVAVANFIAVPLLKNKILLPLLGSVLKRAVVLCILICAAIGIMLIVAPSIFSPILNISGVVASNNAQYTTQELSRPDLGFLFASFGAELILAPIGIILFLLFAHRGGSRTSNITFKNGIGINANYGFAVILAYLFFTAYLQTSAIRYAALVSVPIALFAAYAVYIIGKMLMPYTFKLGGTKIPIVFCYAGLMFIILVYQIIATSQSVYNVQADGIGPQFLQAMTWLSNNTASNATVLALWTDGSVVEGWGNRTSFMDSTFGENGTRIEEFARNFLLNSTPAAPYLYNTSYKPDYLLVRQFWLSVFSGIAEEGGITNNTINNLTGYGTSQFTTFFTNITASNRTFTFSNDNYTAELVIHDLNNGTQAIGAYIRPATGGSWTSLKHILFINSSNGAYSLLNYTGNQTKNFTLCLELNGQNITNAMLLGSALPETNFFKLLIECNQYQCAYNVPGSGVQMQLVYQNADSKIFKINYSH